jgi:hypothetical protein
MPEADHQEQVDEAGSAQAGAVDSRTATPPCTAGSRPRNTAASIPDESLPTGAFCQPRNHRLILTQRALLAIYGSSGPDLGETEEMCHQRVNEWLRTKGKFGVSRATLRRAKRELRALSRPDRS